MVRTTTRLPKDLSDWLADRAKEKHRSANAELLAILSAQKARDEARAYSAPEEK